MTDAIETLVARELDALGYEVVELRRGGSKARPLLEVRMDRRDGAKVTLEDCTRASRALEAQARAAGVAAVSVSGWCTRCHGDRFFSHRGGDAGRQLGIVALR